jgi:hypothetical protein
LKCSSPTESASSIIRTSGSTLEATAKPRRTYMPELYVLTGRSMKSPSSLNSTIFGKRSAISSSLIPSTEQFRRTFSRPVNSGWKPAPSSRRDETRPSTRTVPAVGREMPVRSFRSVDLPAPFSPMMPTVLPRRTSRRTSRSAQNSVWSFRRGRKSSTARWIGFRYIG